MSGFEVVFSARGRGEELGESWQPSELAAPIETAGASHGQHGWRRYRRFVTLCIAGICDYCAMLCSADVMDGALGMISAFSAVRL